jgi:hypothetical protein
VKLRMKGPRETLEMMLAGESLSRFGDGECKIMEGNREFVYFQNGTDELADELRQIIGARSPSTLVGIFDPDCEDKSMRKVIGSWHKRLSKFAYPTNTYYSTLVTRLDSFPSLGTPQWFDRFARLWHGKRVTLIANGVRSLTPHMLLSEGAEQVDFIECSAANAYREIDALESMALATRNDVILICAGMTATCLAARLARTGRQALDLGHIGRFWRRYSDIPVWRQRHDERARAIFRKDGSVVGNPQ